MLSPRILTTPLVSEKGRRLENMRQKRDTAFNHKWASKSDFANTNTRARRLLPLLHIGNPILRKAIEMDRVAANLERAETQFAEARKQILYYNQNNMCLEDLREEGLA